jgi:hypothetical protein
VCLQALAYSVFFVSYRKKVAEAAVIEDLNAQLRGKDLLDIDCYVLCQIYFL